MTQMTCSWRDSFFDAVAPKLLDSGKRNAGDAMGLLIRLLASIPTSREQFHLNEHRLAKEQFIPGWSVPRYKKARLTLMNLGLIKKVDPASLPRRPGVWGRRGHRYTIENSGLDTRGRTTDLDNHE